MSYKFFSFRDPSGQNVEQWAARSVEGEIESCAGRTLEIIFKRYLNPPPAKILEAGCGLGGWVYYLKNLGYQVVGLEYDPAVVAQVQKYDANTPVIQGDIFDLQFEDNTFHAYISLGVVEHFEEGPQVPLKEAYRVLEPGGLGFFTVPYETWFRKLFSHPLREIYFFIRKILKGGDVYFWEYRYSKKDMIRYLKDAGFEIIDVDIDDYVLSNPKHHIGLYADFFFLRDQKEIWALNGFGRFIRRIFKIFSPWFYCSGIHIVVRKPERSK